MKFLRSGAVAIEPKAFGPRGTDYNFDAPPEDGFEMLNEQIAYLTIRGPMSHHPEWRFESYDALLQRFARVCESSAKIAFVSGDTPGGDVSGCFDGARQLRAMFDECGKLLVWYVDGQTCSAGLAWAMAADVIVVPPEGRFGSIGVIAEVHSFKRAAEAMGEDAELITSGSRKADGHPLNEISKDTRAAIQASVDYEADLFYAWVSERRGIPVETVEGWQAGTFHGQQAVDVGLADEVAGESAALAMCAGAELVGAPQGAKQEVDDMSAKSLTASARATLGIRPNQAAAASSAEDSDDFGAVKKKLSKIAAGDDAKKAARAAGMLKKMAEDDSAESEDDEDGEKEKPKEGEEASAAAAASDDEDEDEAAASAAESEDDAASSAEDEEASAKRCEDDAKKAEASARDLRNKAITTLDSGAKDSARVARRFLAQAESHDREAGRLRREAKAHRKLLAQSRVIVDMATQVDRLTKAVARAGVANPSTAAINARGTRGTTPKPPAPKGAAGAAAADADPLASVPEHILRAANLRRTSQAFIQEPDGEVLMGLPTPAEARAVYEKTQARIAALGVNRG